MCWQSARAINRDSIDDEAEFSIKNGTDSVQNQDQVRANIAGDFYAGTAENPGFRMQAVGIATRLSITDSDRIFPELDPIYPLGLLRFSRKLYLRQAKKHTRQES